MQKTNHRATTLHAAVTFASVIVLACLGAFPHAPAAIAQSPVAVAQGPVAAPQSPVAAPQSKELARSTGSETVEADISTHSIEVTSGFSGTKIIIFGAVTSARDLAPAPDVYDIIVAVEGKSQPLVARRKSNVLGLWINVGTLRFDNVPSYYTLASTRPIEKISDADVLARNAIGFDNVKIKANPFALRKYSLAEIEDFRQAVIRLKRRTDLYQNQDGGVKFLGRALFRSSFELPANVPVGPLTASIYLFRDGKLIDSYKAHAELRRVGLQRHLYNLAFNYPLLYGILAVIFAVIAGLSASAVLGRKRS